MIRALLLGSCMLLGSVSASGGRQLATSGCIDVGHQCWPGECCGPAECVDGSCQVPCAGDWESCWDEPCCEHFYCDSHDMMCKPKPPGAACPASRQGKGTAKFCVDTEERPGQATCGVPTCEALCAVACGRPIEGVTPDMCNNSGGGNCQGVTSVLTGADFHGGPCCGCVLKKACPDVLA